MNSAMAPHASRERERLTTRVRTKLGHILSSPMARCCTTVGRLPKQEPSQQIRVAQPTQQQNKQLIKCSSCNASIPAVDVFYGRSPKHSTGKRKEASEPE